MTWGVVLRGLIYGSIDGMIALGLVLVYRSNRIVNFAASALGGVGGVFAVQLFIAKGLPWPLAALIGLVVGTVVGGVVAAGVIRRFAKANRLVLTVATIGLTQLLGGIVLFIPKWLDSSKVLLGGFETPFTPHNLTVGSDLITGDQLVALAAVPIVIGGLAWFLLRTDAGIGIRAAADDADRARTLGIPVRRLEVLIWCLAGGLSTLGFVLRAPFAGVAPTDLAGPQVLLPALAAAVIARMESLPLAFGAAVGLGIIDQTVLWNVTGKTSVSSLLFLVVILVVLLARPAVTSKAARAAATAWSDSGGARRLPDAVAALPEIRWARRGVFALVIAGALSAPLAADQGTVVLYSAAVIWAIVALSLVVLTGWNGNISLGQFAIVGIGAVVAGNAMTHWNLDFFQALVLAGGAGALAAALVGIPALRVRGLFLAVSTLALAVSLDGFVLNPVNFPKLVPGSIDRPVLWGRIDLARETPYYYLCLFFLVVAIGAVTGIRRAHAGRALIAVRDNAPAAGAMGVPVTRTTIGAFIVAGAIAGVAGGLHITLLRGAGSGTYAPIQSIDVFATAVIGGLGSVGGALSGVIAFRILAKFATPEVRLILTGTGLLVVLWLLPGGFAEIGANIRERFAKMVARRRGVQWADEVSGDAAEPFVAVDATIHDDAHAPLISVRNVEVKYGNLQILFGLDLDIADGELVALLGTNGAGKSTLLKAIVGLTPSSGGSIVFDGDTITGEATESLAGRGIALVSGGKGVFPSLSVAENLRLGGWLLRKDAAARQAAYDNALVQFPSLQNRITTAAGDLSGGEQQMLALGMALQTNPRVLLIDELSLGLAPAIVGQLMDTVRELHANGTTVIVVEQSLNVALELADRAAFLEKGRFRFAGETAELAARPDVLRAVFLADVGGQAHPKRERVVDENAPVLECDGVSKNFGGIAALTNVDLTVMPGRIVGLLGANGAGKSTLLDCISGITSNDTGHVRINGQVADGLAPHKRAHLGLGRSMQEARLYPALTVEEVIAVAFEPHLQNRSLAAAALRQPVVDEAEWRLQVQIDELVDMLGLDRWRHIPVGELSTGTRRIVQLACVLAADPSVVLLDEPAGGLAQREVEALVPVLQSVQERTGCSLVIVEHDVPLLRTLCDELVAFEAGEVIASGTPEEVLAHPQVIASYLGDQLAAVERSGTR